MIFRISSVRISDEYLFLRIKTFLTTTHLKKDAATHDFAQCNVLCFVILLQHR